MEYTTTYLKKKLGLGNYDERILSVMMGYVITKFFKRYGAEKIEGSRYKIGDVEVYVGFFKFETEQDREWEVPNYIKIKDHELSKKFEKGIPPFKEIEHNISYFLNESPPLKLPEIIKEYFKICSQYR